MAKRTVADGPAGGGSATATIVWLRADLRVEDNSALERAAASGGPVVPVFVWDPEAAGAWAPGAASRAWLRRSLQALRSEFERHGSWLVLRHGKAEHVLLELAVEMEAGRLIHARRWEPWARAQETRVRDALQSAGVEVVPVESGLLCEPGSVLTTEGERYRVFTPYHRKWRELVRSHSPALSAPPSRLPAPAVWPVSAEIGALLPSRGEPEGLDLESHWLPGEAGARSALAGFMGDRVGAYDDERDHLAVRGTSRLSPHLHHGEVSIDRVLKEARARIETDPALEEGAESFVRQLAWREFAADVLDAHPDLPEVPMDARFEAFPWREAPEDLELWTKGETGFSLVDAGMRQLAETGWMHNRARLVTASFLAKDVLVKWQEGERWFWERLVDADLANNAFGWQWVAGCGADAAPYFRVFNPLLQARRFDRDGAYVARWLPEPYGGTRPVPMLDHFEARDRALAAYEAVKGG
jgi:deoxyribodipyrimidine photo-lyase